MEVEANRFSALLLMPPPLLRPYISKLGDPDLSHVIAIHDDFEVSKDAAARAYAQYHDEPIAVIVVKDGKVVRAYKNVKFPKLNVDQDDEIPKLSVYWRALKSQNALSEVTEIAQVNGCNRNGESNCRICMSRCCGSRWVTH
jgi:Zn-dependent peptidase ImmA (M78 family)